MVTPEWQSRVGLTRCVDWKAAMVADEGGLSIITSPRGGAPNLLIAVSIDLKQIIARNHNHVSEPNGALQCPLQSPLHSALQ